jgi:hypothetical protein
MSEIAQMLQGVINAYVRDYPNATEQVAAQAVTTGIAQRVSDRLEEMYTGKPPVGNFLGKYTHRSLKFLCIDILNRPPTDFQNFERWLLGRVAYNWPTQWHVCPIRQFMNKVSQELQ